MTEDKACFRQKMCDWLQSPTGRRLLQDEGSVLKKQLPNLFGYHFLLLGQPEFSSFLDHSPIHHRIILQSSPVSAPGLETEKPGLIARWDQLPLASESIDVAYLPHLVEFVQNPHEVLREMDRVLRPEGHVIISAFNPWSLWGVTRLLMCRSKKAPWCGHFFSPFKLKEWLWLLGFDVLQIHHCCFLPPLNESAMNKLTFFEALCQKLRIPLGGNTVVVACKRVIPLTPIRPLWKTRRALVRNNLAEPSARG